MDNLLQRLERRLGRYALDNFTLVLIGAQAIAFAFSYVRPGFAQMLVLDPYRVHAGEVWRLFTWLFLPPSFSPIWALFALYWLHTMGTALESQWGAFRYQVYWLIGTVLTTAGAMLIGVPTDNTFLLMSLPLAFGTLWPEYQILLFFIVPVQMRWVALLDAGLLVWAAIDAPGWAALMPVLAVSNYLLFFGGSLAALLRGRARTSARKREQGALGSTPSGVPPVRRCALCGITSADDPNMDFRVCTCEKHGGKPTELCLPHARNH